ncbi:unnamed protein product, partial [Oppiella nova]
CGSCWAFSAIAALEGQLALKTGKLVSLSEQNVMDCSHPQGNNGCGGGLMDYAYEYIIKQGGVDTEASYPYKMADLKCTYKKESKGASIQNYTDVRMGDEEALKEAVANVGPIAVAIDAQYETFQLYKSGVYDEPLCFQ